MKQLFLILCFALTPLQACAWEVIGSGSPVADYCADKLGSYSLYFDADHPNGTTTACVAGGTTTATFTGVTASDTVNSNPGGTYGVLWDGTINKYVILPATGLSSGNGRIEFDYIPTATPTTSANAGLWEWYGDSSNYITVRAKASGTTIQIVATHRKDATSITAQTAYVEFTGSEVYRVVADWSSVTGKIQVQFNNGAVAQNASGTVAAFTSDPANGVRFGEDLYTYSHGQPIGFDVIKFGANQQ